VGQNQTIVLPGLHTELREVCPVGSNRLVSFGFNGVGHQISIIDLLKGSVTDSFPTYDPVMSPNQRWIAHRLFYPPQSEVQLSEEYLLYDLDAAVSQNLHVDPSRSDARGWAMYPAFPDDVPTERMDVPDANTHQWRSKAFFWGADSQSVVFADNSGKILSLVLVLIENGKPQAYTHAVSGADACAGGGSGEPYLNLESATVSALSGAGPYVVALFQDPSGDFACRPRQLDLALNDFRPATVEFYAPPKKRESRPVGKAP
jgi:hypothetical protein